MNAKRWGKRVGIGVAIAAVLVLLGVVVIAIGGGGGGGGESAMVHAPLMSSGSAGFTATDAAGASAGGSAATASGSVTAAATAGGPSLAPLPAGIGDPKVIRTATIGVQVRRAHFSDRFSDVASIAAANGGFVASSTASADSASPSDTGVASDHATGFAAASLVVRVPADRFDATRRQLAGLGKVVDEQIAGEDVGGRLTDLDARLRNLRAQEEALRLLMDKAKTIGETIQVQQQLSGVREQIEQLAGEQARLSNAVALSTITVNLTVPGAGISEPSRLGDSLSRAAHGAESVVVALVVVAGYLLPLALLAIAAWLVTRPLARRRRPTALLD